MSAGMTLAPFQFLNSGGSGARVKEIFALGKGLSPGLSSACGGIFGTPLSF
jgi:hypothetical protein